MRIKNSYYSTYLYDLSSLLVQTLNLLIGCHNAGNNYVIREVCLELPHALNRRAVIKKFTETEISGHMPYSSLITPFINKLPYNNLQDTYIVNLYINTYIYTYIKLIKPTSIRN